jgi:hypothetical protein
VSVLDDPHYREVQERLLHLLTAEELNAGEAA